MGRPLPVIAQMPEGIEADTPLWRGTTVTRALGISYRRFDNWVAQGAIRPTIPAQGSGSLRLLTIDDILTTARVAHLRPHGIPLSRIADELYDRLLPDDWADAAIDSLPGPDCYGDTLTDCAGDR
jgi:hypothetical protein